MMQLLPHYTTRLSSLLHGICQLPEALDREVTGIELDSRRISPGALFMACRGAAADGRRHISDAIQQGASAVLVEADNEWRHCLQQNTVPVVPVNRLPEMMHLFAARFYGEPASALRLMGITGTNGKTTCCHLLARLLAKLGKRCGVIGTLGFGMAGETLEVDSEGPGTTPDAVRLQRILARLRDNAADTVVMEVSSHGLAQSRVDINAFSLALFTNLSRDHLDFHADIIEYGNTKRRLFHGRQLQTAVLNLDDPFSAGTRAELAADVSCFTWSLDNTEAEVYASNIAFTPAGLQMQVVTPWGEYSLQSPLYGSFNASNLLGVLCAALACEREAPDFSAARIVEALQQLPGVAGRMQRVGAAPVSVLVDYAHTPDGLEKALAAVREHCSGRVHCVFGCGGDRDKGKRPLMGAVAERLADSIILTDDNPRSEDSMDIIAKILAGVQNPAKIRIETSRASAIQAAIALAEPGDVVLIAGKGHETWQETRGKRVPFNDARQAQLALAARFAHDSGPVAKARGLSD